MAAASRLRASLFYRAPPILAGRPQIARFSLAASRLRQSGSAIHEPPSEIPFLPRFLQPTTYIPSWSRRRQQASEPSPSSAPPAATKTGAAKRSIFRGEWNPATFFIWIFLLIGSQAIHILKIKNDSTDYMRKSEARIQLLAEVIRKLQSGERVDVEKALGTGKKMSEIDWEQALREIEEEDRLWNTRLADQDAELRELEEAENKGEKKKKKRYQGPKKDNKPGDEAAKPKKRTAKDYEIL